MNEGGADMPESRKFMVIASVFGLTGVALGAFGAHSLKSAISSEMLSVFETGVRYQMYHSFALYVVSWALQSKRSTKFLVAAWSFVAGVILFSGSLYILAMSGIRWFGIVTPIGGVSLLGGWLMATLGFLEKKAE